MDTRRSGAEVRSALITHFRQNPEVAKTALRLALDLSKDEFDERIGPELKRCGLTWRDLKEMSGQVGEMYSKGSMRSWPSNG
jgi:hypothetical protein